MGQSEHRLQQLWQVRQRDYHDALRVDDFKLEVPEGTRILGLTVEIRRSAGEGVGDDLVRIIKGGQPCKSERAKADVWSQDLSWTTYEGADDLWGEDWTSADVNAPEFGLALATAYLRDAGNTRPYVDTVRVTVRYEECL